MLPSRMMDFPLTITHLLERAREIHPKSEIVSRMPDKTLRRHTYADLERRAAKLANALTKLGVQRGDRVATLAWNHHRHLEAYFGIPAMGAVVHTLNLRLHPNELAYIANHGEDKVVIVDRSLLPLFAKFRDRISTLRHVIIIADDGPTPAGELDYEALLADARDEYEYPALAETEASMLCYTSGTTGNPKGVLYSHRSIILHALVGTMRDALSVGNDDIIMPVVPMFHASAWGLPYMAVTTGAKLVFPGSHLDPVSLLDLMAQERVTIAGGVPTIWIGILNELDKAPKRWDLSTVRTMVIGGAAAPPSMIDGFSKRHNLDVIHAWGMTEMNPLGTVARVRHHLAGKSEEERLAIRASQGYPVPFVEQRHVGADGKTLPWDGETMGELEVRGPWVAVSYFGDEGADRFTKDGWFKTGDVVTIDADGYMRITDRSKDVIKSGGEWISSVDLENALMSHPSVLEAAVFAGRDPKWDERPVAAIVLKEGESVTDGDLAAHLGTRFAKFWLPDAYVYMAQIPRTSTGKFLKSKLREEHGDVLVNGTKASSSKG